MNRIIQLDSTDPYLNLAYENMILRDTSESRAPYTLILWQSSPCVVLGNFQNPLKECDLDSMSVDKIPLVRRQSGGGAVFHDLGNLNFSIICDSNLCSLDKNFLLLQMALHKFKLSIIVDEKNSVFVNNKKISGNAFKKTKDRVLHHGTLLVKSNLTNLRKYLTPEKEIEGRAINSKNAKVTNLHDLSEEITVESLSHELIWQFSSLYGTSKFTTAVFSDDLQKDAQKLKGWEMLFERTPLFNFNGKEVRKGKIGNDPYPAFLKYYNSVQ